MLRSVGAHIVAPHLHSAVRPTGNVAGLLARAKSVQAAPEVSLPDVELPPFNYTPPPYTGPSQEEVEAMRKEFVNPGIFHYYKKPVMLVDAKQLFCFDSCGRRYLDAFAGIVTVSVGHAHPKVSRTTG